jgi:hypothetical protein
MTTDLTPASEPIPSTAADDRVARVRAIVRDISIGGLTGLIAGILVGGLGGRLVMRLAAVLVPETTGLTTANGNRIGAITVEGTLLLVVFGGLFAGVVAGGIWVVVRPWLPTQRGRRALASIPLALAFGTPLLIEGDNVDFSILDRDPTVIAALLVLVALAGPAMVLIDDWLDRQLPGTRNRPALFLYLPITAFGLFLTLFLTVPLMFQIGSAVVLFAIVGVGIATLLHWRERVAGRPTPSPTVERIARVALVIAVTLGLGRTALDVLEALGLR